MRTTSQPDASTAGRVDEICDRFERAWRGGQSPRIEIHLQDTQGTVRDLMLRELLLLEIDLRLESADRPPKEEYLERFPSEAGLIEEIFQEITQSQSPAVATTIAAADSSSTPGASAGGTDVPPELETFGDYQVLEQLGRGGMGVVYRARQQSANRIVALKLIRHDHLSGLPEPHREEIVDRFHNEALATASLDHDHIVTVYEVGEIDGQHFFSMQYVGGPSLDQVLAKGPMEARQAAKKLIPVARALHAAHQRGVLHRDVKPCNLLIDPQGDRLLLADFGLAKLREADVALTKAGTTFGSPPYMAPEQVRDAANVSEAADIYGLGATLYKMLTGRPPFQAATVADTLCQVLADQPPAPHELNPAIDRDLDTLCMKCLEKDPARRYGSAEEVAEELERFVRREPIRARPIGHLGRFVRWCRRNPMLSTVVIVAAALLTIAATVATIAALWASAALKGEVEQRQLAEDRLDKTLQIMDGQQQFFWENPAMKSRGLETLRRNWLQSGADRYDKLVAQRPDDPDMLARQATAHYRLADMSDETGQTERAEEEYQTALDIQQRACQMDPANDACKRDRAESFAALGRLCRKIGKFDKAEGAAQEALQICLGLSDEDPENRRELADSHAELGKLMEDSARPGDAMREREAELAIRKELVDGHPRDHPKAAEYLRELAKCLGSMGASHFAVRQFEEAESCYEEALKYAERLIPEKSPENHEEESPENQEALAVAYSEMGVFYQGVGRFDEAESKLKLAQELIDRLAEEHHDVPRYRSNQALGWNALAEVYRANQRFQEAESALQNAIDIGHALAKDYPSMVKYRVDLAFGYHNLARHYLAVAGDKAAGDAALGALAAAEAAAKQALGMFQELAEKHPRIPNCRSDFAWAQIHLGELYADTERMEPAEQAFQMAVAKLASLVEECPKVPLYRRRLAIGHENLSKACMTLGDLAEQEGAFEEACRWYETARNAGLKVEQERPQDAQAKLLVVFTARQRALLLHKLDRHADALADLQLAIDRAEPEDRQAFQREAMDVAVALAQSGNHAAAATKAEEILNAQGAEAPSDLAVSAARVLAQAAGAVKLDGKLDKSTAEQQRQTYLSKAIDSLRKAHRARFFEEDRAREWLRSDPDLAPLRQHDDFRKLLEEIGLDPDEEPPIAPQPRVASATKRTAGC